MDIIHCDIAIIGAGSGGLSVAAGAAKLGAKVVLIEKNKIGGDCLNAGCVPSKSLIAAARANWQAKNSEKFGIKSDSVKTVFKTTMQHVHNVIEKIAENDSVERFERLGVKVILSPGKFIAKKTVQAGEYQIKAKRFVVATGSSPVIPPISGIDKVPYLTNESIFNLAEQPDHLIAIGGGPISAELSQAVAMLGVKVTILESRGFLHNDDSDCVNIVKEELEKTGVLLQEGIEINAIEKSDGKIEVKYKKEGKPISISGSHLLVATGRKANVQDLNLEKAGINYTERGIKVDNRLRTSNKKVFAIGDVAGGFQFTHIAGYHAGIVLKNILFHLPAKVDYKAVPWVTYTAPELAHVGLSTEKDKKEKHMVVTEWPFDKNDRAQTEANTVGKIKVLTCKKGRILGVTIVGPHAGELILPWVMAIREGKTLRNFTDVIAPYPTLSEISKKVASEFYAPMLFSNKIRKLVKWLMICNH